MSPSSDILEWSGVHQLKIVNNDNCFKITKKVNNRAGGLLRQHDNVVRPISCHLSAYRNFVHIIIVNHAKKMVAN